VNLRDVAESYGTPTYVYDRADIRRACADLRHALPAPSRLYYSVKANPHPDVASELARLGCRAEVASAGEVDAALAAGFRAGEVIMNGPGKSRWDIEWAIGTGMRHFSVDSPTDLARVGTVAEELGAAVTCLLRVNADQPVPGMGLSMTGTASGFGADASWVLAEPERFRRYGGASVTGLHLYMGTNIDDVNVLATQFETSIRLAAQVRAALGIELTEVDLGGGFGAPYARSGGRNSYAALAPRLEPLLDELMPGWRDGCPTIAFESGRYLLGGCGILVCRVLDVKVSKGRTFVVLDSGINHLGGMSGLRRIPRIVPDLVTAREPEGFVDDCAVVGPLCTPLDSWSQGVTLPRLYPGDVLAVPNVGAYGLTAGLLAFLGHRPPTEVVLDGAEEVSVSRLTMGRTPVRTPATVAS
jgi:diaminopimelate decarboxylase